MKLAIFVVSIVIGAATLVEPTFAQSAGAAAARLSTASSTQPQTITGRITRLDAKSGLFSVRSGDNGQVVDLIARKDAVVHLRRGERVTVTYQAKTATRIQATRSEK
jgi:hypothetical protein